LSEVEDLTARLIGRWSLEGNRILITGCAGFIGSWLAEAW